MTDAKQKPRVFRLSPKDASAVLSDYNTLELIPEDEADSVMNEEEKLYCKATKSFHVIEKSAYDKLLVRLERTKSAAYHALLEMSAWLGIPEHKRKAQIEYLMENINYCADTDISKRDNEAKNE